MKTVEIKLYKFEELSEEIQAKVLSNQIEINVDYEWWDFTYEDAKTIGLEIEGFDLYRGDITTNIMTDPNGIAILIIGNHGKECDTYEEAIHYLANQSKLVEKYSDGMNKDIVIEDNEHDYDLEIDEVENEFMTGLKNAYLSILQNEYEYLRSEEAIKETIESNDYDFTEDGDIY